MIGFPTSVGRFFSNQTNLGEIWDALWKKSKFILEEGLYLRSFLGKKLLLVSLVFVVVGLILLVYPDPQFRAIFSGGSTSGFPTTFTSSRFTFNGSIPRGNFTFPGAGNFTRRAGSTAALINTNNEIVSLLGAGLVAVGVVFVVLELFLTPGRLK